MASAASAAAEFLAGPVRYASPKLKEAAGQVRELVSISAVGHLLPSSKEGVKQMASHLVLDVGLRKLAETYLYRMQEFEEASFIPRFFGNNIKYVDFVAEPCDQFINLAYYFSLLANGIYSQWAEDFLAEEWAKPDGAKWMQPLAVATASLRERPRFGYFIDHYRKTLVLAVRGTSQLLVDAATDIEISAEVVAESSKTSHLSAEYEMVEKARGSLPPGGISPQAPTDHLAHHGFMASARNILADSVYPFARAYAAATEELGFEPTIYVTGHSLGASTSACIVFLLRKRGFDAKGVLFAPAPCFSQELIEDEPDACKNNIVSFINRFDAVTRLEAGIVQRSEFITACSLSKDPAARANLVKLVQSDDVERQKRIAAFVQNRSFGARPVDQDLAVIANDNNVHIDVVTEAASMVEEKVMDHASRRTLRSCKAVTLATPGRRYWLHYYCSDADRNSVGMYRITSNDFFDYLPPVYGRTNAKNATQQTNVGSDHSMSNYCAHLYFIKQSKERTAAAADPAISGEQMGAVVAVPVADRPETIAAAIDAEAVSAASIPAAEVVTVAPTPVAPRAPVAPKRATSPPVMPLPMRSRSKGSDYLTSIAAAAVAAPKRAPPAAVAVVRSPSPPSADWQAEWKAWLKETSQTLPSNEAERRATAMHPGLTEDKARLRRERERRAMLARAMK